MMTVRKACRKVLGKVSGKVSGKASKEGGFGFRGDCLVVYRGVSKLGS